MKKAREESKVSVGAKEQWNIDAIHVNAQEYKEVEDKVKVAVMDTGITATEDIDVAGRINLIEGEEDVHPLYEDVSGHGTAVASVIAAAGNLGEEAGKSTVEYPAAFEEVLAVGATTPKGTISDMSSVGEEIELVAPGEDVPATGYYGEVICTEGTSMAAPHVTGVASVLWAKDTSKSSDFIRALLNVSAITVDDIDKGGNGMVDLEYALSVYDEFAENYVEEVVTVEENPAEVEVYEEAEVEACWPSDKHADAVALYKDITGSFHGYKNYVANYMYVMRMAEICVTDGIKAAVKKAVYPAGGQEGQIQIYNAMVEFTTLTNNKDSYRARLQKNGFSNTKKNQACLLVGIASHIAMDAYAHQACINVDGTWQVIPKEFYKLQADGTWKKVKEGTTGAISSRDLKTYVPE